MEKENTQTGKSETGHQKKDPEAFNNLIEILKKAESRQFRKLRIVYILLFLTALCFVMVLSFTHQSIGYINQLIIINIIVAAILIAALILRKHYINTQKLDYTRPVSTMLHSTEKKYRFWNREWIIIIALIIIINMLVSILFNSIHLSEDWTSLQRTILAQSIFLPLLTLAFLFEWITWKKYQRPLWKQIIQIMKMNE